MSNPDNIYGPSIARNVTAGKKCCRCKTALDQRDSLPCGPATFDRTLLAACLQLDPTIDLPEEEGDGHKRHPSVSLRIPPGGETCVCIFCRVLCEVLGQARAHVEQAQRTASDVSWAQASAEFALVAAELAELMEFGIRRHRRFAIAGMVGQRWMRYQCEITTFPCDDDDDATGSTTAMWAANLTRCLRWFKQEVQGWIMVDFADESVARHCFALHYVLEMRLEEARWEWPG